MKVTTESLYKHCYGKYAVAAVNVANMEQIIGLFAAAESVDSPVIIQTTPYQRNYSSPAMLSAMIDAASKMYPSVIYAVHIDHGTEEHIHHAIDSGDYTSVMIDASHDDFQSNVSRTRAIVDLAHPLGITVEAELGVLAGVEDNMTEEAAHTFYTNPDEVEEFVKSTGCDSLAIAVGTSHGAYKFSGGQGLQFPILEEIQKRLPQYPLVLHGGSAVNYAEIDRINKAGGTINTSAKGVDPNEIKQAISFGICKVNIATDIRLLWTRVAREFFRDQPEEFMPTKVGKVYMKEFTVSMAEKFKLLRSAGQGQRFKKAQ